MRNKQIKANGVELFTESTGDPSDPAVLLIMGVMASAVWWPEEFCQRLAGRGRHVIRYDQRDTGRSVSYTPGRIEYSVEDMADDAVGVLSAYGVERAHLVGFSLGGFLSQLVALKYPERVRTLTLIGSERLGPHDPAMPPMDPRVPAYHARAGTIDWSGREAVAEYAVEAWRLLAGSAHPFDEATVRALVAQEIERTDNMLTKMNHAQLSGGERWFGRLDEIRVPALVIHGTEDPVLPYAHGLALAEALPQTTLLTLEGTGHELHRNDWGVIIDAVARHTDC